VLDVVEKRKQAAILDIRSPDEFSGKLFAPEGSKELSVRAGHVPGAKNVPWSKAVDADTGKFKPAEELKKIYAEAGIDGSQDIIAYCRIGERSSHSWYALTRILGYKARNYDGSWTEYGNSVGVPVANLSGTVWTGK
jgi:thiosulfate/3-mercaptopyruvate sulfurtransferase